MAGNNAFNNNDSMDINELAALNNDISPELIEQLQQQLSVQAENFSAPSFNENDDATLFEEPKTQSKESSQNIENQASENAADNDSSPLDAIYSDNTTPEEEIPTEQPSITNDTDNFAQKYQAKLDNQKVPFSNEFSPQEEGIKDNTENTSEENENQDINQLTNGSITERTMTQAQKEYNDSLDLLDGNVKYSKYVIYIDPQNVDFIESLTVKERKNLINKILKDQDNISVTKKNFRTIQTVIRHAIVAILTVTISIPVIYYAINASLEASINNYRRSQTNFQTLYREKGKINIKQPGK